MIRRRSARREGPGLLRTVGRTAVIAGTATAVSQSVSNSNRSASARYQQESVAQPTPQPEIQAQIESAQAQEIGEAADTGLIGQLKDLADLRSAGMLTDAEFEAAKARVLAG
jgi:hypothetical protein